MFLKNDFVFLLGDTSANCVGQTQRKKIQQCTSRHESDIEERFDACSEFNYNYERNGKPRITGFKGTKSYYQLNALFLKVGYLEKKRKPAIARFPITLGYCFDVYTVE